MTTKTEQAIEYIEKQGMTVRQAARKADISESALHAAVKKRKAAQLKAQGICACCGQKLPTSEKPIDT